ncbi:ATP-dependent nuclease [Paenibacillus xylanilyticus]|uniref:ATP-dependent nuclease n=1 Tax=Paenibacillus xylanilyticus TaxID=248903 RepID=UPI00129DD232|nr:AAA family ATPase [Paenibacillus xylanilyticus]
MEIFDTDDISLIEKNIKAFEGGAFKNFIKYIKFPFFKNLEQDTEINFSFPLTVFVGENGAGKSSLLQALYGAPKGKSPGEFWFSTSVDPIEEFGENRHCFFYGFYDGNELKEVLKTRAKRKKNPDYWETSRPIKRYNMKVIDRYGPIEKEVLYLDFRSELSAFDQFFYFGELKEYLASKTKQDYLRNQSAMLKRVFDENKIYTSGAKEQNKGIVNLTKTELNLISYILGRKYNSGRIARHKLFGNWGTSVVLEREGFKYSEAHAGSGEIAIVKLVHELLKAPNGSLILLDEPEVSLHPGAQKRLKILLLKLSLEKKHQIVISTHSSNFVENLPKEAIKLFYQQVSNNKIKVQDECWYNEAFYRLGDTYSLSYRIQVEDRLAQKLVQKVIDHIGRDKFRNLDVFFAPGGASVIKNSYIKLYSSEFPNQHFVIFDGDQKPNLAVKRVANLTLHEAESTEFLSKMIEGFAGGKVSFEVDGNSMTGGRTDQLVDLQKKYINFYNNNVFYLPLNIPDEIIWDENHISHLIKDKTVWKSSIKGKNAKQKIYETSNHIFGNSSNVNALEDLLINNWIDKESKERQEIINILFKILDEINKINVSVPVINQ